MPHKPESNGTPHVQEKRRRRRGEILGAALGAFREKGFHGTTLDDIAERLGVRKAALYHYFPDKQAILQECHQESLGELQRILREARKLDTATDKLAHIIHEHVRVMAETLQGSPLAMEVRAFSPDRQKEMILHRDRYEREVRRIIDQGIRTGEFRKVDSKIATFVILGAINWIARWYREDGGTRPEDIGRFFADLFVRALEAPPARPPAGAGRRSRS
jgi:AcrR family transcriptional regulator